jgi:hypothetical protein
MEEKQILKAVADTFTDKPLYEMVVKVRVVEEPEVIVTPEPAKRSFWDKLLGKPLPVPTAPATMPEPERERMLTFYPAVVANQYRIAGEASLLPSTIYVDQSLNLSLIPEHQKRMVYIIAAALQNNHLEPDNSLIQFIERNFTGEQLREALTASFQTLNMEAFTDTIVLMKGIVNILQTSPQEGSELIASHTEA